MKSESESGGNEFPPFSCKGDCSAVIHSQIKNLQAYLKERQLHRAKYYGQPLYSVSASSININGAGSTSTQRCGVPNSINDDLKIGAKIKEDAESGPGFLNDPRAIHFAWHIPNKCPEFVERSPISQNDCSSTRTVNLPVKEIIGYNHLSTMSASNYYDPVYDDASRPVSSHKHRFSSPLDISCTPEFSGIMSNLFQLMMRAVYQIFLVILQLVPFVEIFPRIYEFAVQGFIELKEIPDRREMVGRACIFLLEISTIIAACLFIVCVVWFPVMSLGRSVLRTLFFFV